MAKRPIFIPYTEGLRLVKEEIVEFKWHAGFAAVQKQKSLTSLHEEAAKLGFPHLLEVSSKSTEKLGIRLSAFNFKTKLESGIETTIECAFQGSKVFEDGGPFTDLYTKSSLEAKRDDRLKNHGDITAFQLEQISFPNEPKTAFYDWLYIRAMMPHQKFLMQLNDYSGFTDIEFNPGKSINCQARSCAIFVSLMRKGLLDEAISSPSRFIQIVSPDSFAQPYSKDTIQGKLF